VYGADNKDARLVKIEYRHSRLPGKKPPVQSRVGKPATVKKTGVPPHPGKALIESSDCGACHQYREKAVGPSYLDIMRRYKGKVDAVQALADKIIAGGAGNWGTEAVMSAHPQLSDAEARKMVEYILSVPSR
jgi:cytochrome c